MSELYLKLRFSCRMGNVGDFMKLSIIWPFALDQSLFSHSVMKIRWLDELYLNIINLHIYTMPKPLLTGLITVHAEIRMRYDEVKGDTPPLQIRERRAIYNYR